MVKESIDDIQKYGQLNEDVNGILEVRSILEVKKYPDVCEDQRMRSMVL